MSRLDQGVYFFTSGKNIYRSLGFHNIRKILLLIFMIHKTREFLDINNFYKQ